MWGRAPVGIGARGIASSVVAPVVCSVVIVLLAAGCSSSASDVSGATDAAEGRTFCDQAAALQTFQNDAAVDLADPTKAPAFIEVAIDQLKVLGEKAPDDIKPEIDQVVAGYEALDAELAASDYRLDALLVSDYQDPEASAANDRLDTFLGIECGLRAGRPDIDAPQPFSAAELEALINPDGASAPAEPTVDDATLIDLLTTSVGLTSAQAECLVGGLGDDAAAVLLGDPLVGEAKADFDALLADCSIDPEEIG
ncbi:MAG: hypothetical protein R2710_17220 [Acidimicrobiales bacterium]